MSNKLMTPTEKEVDFFSVYGKECNGCKRHSKDMMLSYNIKEDKTLLRTLTPKMEVYEKFKNLGIDKKVLLNIIESSQEYKTKEAEFNPSEIQCLFMSDKQAEDLIKTLQKTLEQNKKNRLSA